MNFIDYIRRYQYTHIPSALSQIYYLNHVFGEKLVEPFDHNIVLGKPFGHAAYYYIWEKLGYLEPMRYSNGVRHEEITFVDFSDVTIGNALGVASGIEMGNDKMTYVNMSDSQLQMGSVMEAIQFIGRHQQNIKVTIDYNKSQLTSNLLTTLEADQSMFRTNAWYVSTVNDNNLERLRHGFDCSGPSVMFVNTTKGKGVQEMIDDPEYWHYRPIGVRELTTSNELRNL